MVSLVRVSAMRACCEAQYWALLSHGYRFGRSQNKTRHSLGNRSRTDADYVTRRFNASSAGLK
jgi:hypothetical protein